MLYIFSHRSDVCTGKALLPIGAPLLGGTAIISPFDVGQRWGGPATVKGCEVLQRGERYLLSRCHKAPCSNFIMTLVFFNGSSVIVVISSILVIPMQIDITFSEIGEVIPIVIWMCPANLNNKFQQSRYDIVQLLYSSSASFSVGEKRME